MYTTNRYFIASIVAAAVQTVLCMGAAKTTSLKQTGGAAKLGAAVVPGERISETRLTNETDAFANLNNTQSRGGGNGSVIDSGDEDEGYEDRGNGTAGNKGSGGGGDGSDDGDDGDENSASGNGEDGLQSDDEGKESEVPILIVHEQPVPRQDTGEDGFLPVKDDWLDMLDRIDDQPNAEQAAYERASQMAYLIRDRASDERCKTSVALCDSYTPMWPQIDGLCDLFFVKCLVEVAGMVCRNYTEKDIFKYAPDLCDNVSDFCTQNREAVIAFCWGHLYQRYSAIAMNPQPKKTGFNKFMDYLILGLSGSSHYT